MGYSYSISYYFVYWYFHVRNIWNSLNKQVSFYYEFRGAIKKALSEDAEVNVAVNALIAERALKSPEK